MVSPTSTISNISPPLITPHASPPIHTQVRRSSSTSTGTTSTKASESNMLSPEERISKLLSTISSVLVAYSKSLNTSPRYMNSLIEFFHRAISLCPDPKAVPQLPTLPSSTLSSGSNGSSSNTPFSAILLQSHPPLTHNNGDHHNHNTRRNSGHSNLIDTHQHLPESTTKSQHIHPRKVGSDSRGESERLEKKVRRLEKDWWTSEIVAAWYGPTVNPNLSRKLSDSSNKTFGPSPPMSRRQSLNIANMDDSSFIELGDKKKKVAERRESSFTLLSAYRKQKQRDEWLEPILRRDASYVGLHDE